MQRDIRLKRSALRVPGGNQVDGLPPARHTEPRSIGWARHPRTSVNFVIVFEIAFLIKLYIMVTSFALSILKISILKFHFVGISASELDRNFVNDRPLGFPKF